MHRRWLMGATCAAVVTMSLAVVSAGTALRSRPGVAPGAPAASPASPPTASPASPPTATQASPPRPAVAARPLGCGSVLAGDGYLAADLDCPAGNGVTVTASATIDLRGHQFSGSRGGTGITAEYPASVKVQRGRLEGWGTALTVHSAVDNPESRNVRIAVYAVTFLANGIGLAPNNIAANGWTTPVFVVSRSSFVGNDIGVGGVINNSDTSVDHSSFRNNRAAVSVESDDFAGAGSVSVTGSTLGNNGTALNCSGGVVCSLTDSGLRDNPTAVIADYWSTGVYLERDTITGSTMGVRVEDIRDLSVSDTVFAGNGTGVSFAGSYGSVLRNTFVGNGSGLLINAHRSAPDAPPVTVTGNRVLNSRSDGIVAVDYAVLKGNNSQFNGRWGIHAVGVGDKGGNSASGNGHEPQCSGVVC